MTFFCTMLPMRSNLDNSRSCAGRLRAVAKLNVSKELINPHSPPIQRRSLGKVLLAGYVPGIGPPLNLRRWHTGVRAVCLTYAHHFGRSSDIRVVGSFRRKSPVAGATASMGPRSTMLSTTKRQSSMRSRWLIKCLHCARIEDIQATVLMAKARRPDRKKPADGQAPPR